MELKDFVSRTLRDIHKGIEDANSDLPRVSPNHSPFFTLPQGYSGKGDPTGIEFDVAVTVSSSEKSGAGGGVQIAVLRATIGGEDAKQHEEVSRIKFTVIPN